MCGIFDARNAASCFDLTHPFFEQALSVPGTNDREPLGFRYRGIIDELLLEPTFPHIEIVSCNRLHVACGQGEGCNLIPDQASNISMSASAVGTSVR